MKCRARTAAKSLNCKRRTRVALVFSSLFSKFPVYASCWSALPIVIALCSAAGRAAGLPGILFVVGICFGDKSDVRFCRAQVLRWALHDAQGKQGKAPSSTVYT